MHGLCAMFMLEEILNFGAGPAAVEIINSQGSWMPQVIPKRAPVLF
jgi:hypothetical protein